MRVCVWGVGGYGPYMYNIELGVNIRSDGWGMLFVNHDSNILYM